MELDSLFEALKDIPNGVFIVFAALLTTLGAIAIAWQVQKRNAFRDASRAFREAFNNVVSFLDHSRNQKNGELHAVLIADFEEQKIAVAKFRDALPKRRIKGFDRAWTIYWKLDTDPLGGEEFEKIETPEPFFAYDSFSPEDEEEAKEVIRTRLKKLFSYAPIR
jgi:hypothetical protein